MFVHFTVTFRKFVVDIDECTVNPTICSELQCVNTYGSYTCLSLTASASSKRSSICHRYLSAEITNLKHYFYFYRFLLLNGLVSTIRCDVCARYRCVRESCFSSFFKTCLYVLIIVIKGKLLIHISFREAVQEVPDKSCMQLSNANVSVGCLYVGSVVLVVVVYLHSHHN